MGQKLINKINEVLNTPLENWSDGWLKFECASKLNEPMFVIMTEKEKQDKKFPISRIEMIKYLRNNGKYL